MGITINGLMKHLRNNHGIEISGSKQKKQLLNMGYYHGYKGYRFVEKSTRRISFRTFDEISSVYDFDMKLKTVLYPNLMLLETSLKSHALDAIIRLGRSDFDYVFSNLLNDYAKETLGSSDYRKKMRRRLELRNSIYSSIAQYSERPVIEHFLHGQKAVPLWAIFEVISLGTFEAFFECLNKNTREAVTHSMGIVTTSYDQKNRILGEMISFLKDLRNAVAHNSVVFDCRFRPSRQKPSAGLKAFLSHETKINDITFEGIVDYLILIVYLCKNIGISKTQLRNFVKDFYKETEILRSKLPTDMIFFLLGSDLKLKIESLQDFIGS